MTLYMLKLLTGTEKVSSIWNSGGSAIDNGIRVDSRFMNILSRCKFSPVTLDTWKIGHILEMENSMERTASEYLVYCFVYCKRHSIELNIV